MVGKMGSRGGATLNESPSLLSKSEAMPFVHSVFSGLVLIIGVIVVWSIFVGIASAVCRRTWPCAQCKRMLPLEDVYLKMGEIVDCQECGSSNVIRPHASVLGWFILWAAYLGGAWTSYLLLQLRWKYKLEWLNSLDPHAPKGGPADQSGAEIFFFLTILIIFCGTVSFLNKVFYDEKDPGPQARRRL